MSEYLAQAKILKDKLETLTNDIDCLKDAIEYTHSSAMESKNIVNAQFSGIIGLFLAQTEKILEESSALETIAIKLAN